MNLDKLDSLIIKPLYEPRLRVDEKLGKFMKMSRPRYGHIEQSIYDSAIISGTIKKYKPKYVLELGVAAGGGAA